MTFRPFCSLAIFATLALTASSCSHARSTAPRHPPRLVLISIDGLRPAFYTAPQYRKAAPTLAQMSDDGERAPEGIQPIFPTLTYPNHVAMMTGAYSAHNGVYSNQIYSSTLGVTEDWYFYANEIRVPTIAQAAHKAGLKVGLIRWPGTEGSRVDWNFPEIFYPDTFDIPRDWILIQKSTEPPSFLQEIKNAGPVKRASAFADIDQLSLQAFEDLLDRHDPDLILIHLANLDYVQHLFGTDAPEVTQAAAGIDSILAKIRARLDPTKTTVIVTGDHGFASFHHFIHIAPLIREAGVQDRLVALPDGGQTAIFQVPGGPRAFAADCGKILEASRKYGRILHLISRRKLNALHAYPLAVCGFEAQMGYAFSGRASTKVVEELPHPHGHHGYLPSRTEMRAGFFIWGRAVDLRKTHFLRGDSDGEFKMIDIAPTAAAILGIPFNAPDGTALGF